MPSDRLGLKRLVHIFYRAMHVLQGKVLLSSVVRLSVRPSVRDVDKGEGQVLDIALLHDEHMLRSALQSRKWQLIDVS